MLRKLGYFGHIAILRGDVDVTQTTSTAVLAAARYVGVLREKPVNSRNLAGVGMLFWLGDEDNKGKVLETKLSFAAKSLTYCVTALLPPAVRLGTIHDPGGTYTGVHQWETPRQALDTICAAFGVEYRVNGDSTVDVGTQAQLYAAVPDSILSARGAGADLDMQSIGTVFEPGGSAVDYTTRVALLGQTQDNATIVEATADAPSIPYLDMQGNPVAFTRMISDSGQTTGSVTAAAQLNLNRFNRTTTVIKVTAEEYSTSGNFVVGDNSDVFDPDNGILDTSRQLDFRGELIHPAVVRISAMTWSVTEGHTVVFRAQDGTLLDLTRWMVWEGGTTDITVGDLPKTLTTGSNPAQDRVNSVPDTSIPGAPTGLTLSTAAVLSSTGQSTATVSASWTPPATNTDGSVVTDLAYYVVQYRWHGRAPQWDTRYVPAATIDIPALAVGLLYDVQVAAVDLAGHVSAFTAVSSITTAHDTAAPNPPQDPTVSAYLGQLKITWSGLDNVGGAMPSDFAIVEVHVSATSGFTPTTATLVTQMSAAGSALATAPYGAVRYVKLVAVDNSGNRSAPSGQVSGSTVKAGDGDISDLSVGKLTAGTMTADVVVGGRFATALTGGRVEMNSLGFQKFASDGTTKLISLTGTEALLTGTYKTALTGRRIEVGSGGTTGQVNFIAPDGTTTYLKSINEGGAEVIRMSAPVTGLAAQWNGVQVDSTFHTAFISGDNVEAAFSVEPGSGGVFMVSKATSRGTPTTAPTLISRFQIGGTSLGLFDDAGNPRFYVDSDDSVGPGYAQFNFHSTNQKVQLTPGAGDRSGTVGLYHNVGGYGALLQYVANSGDGFTGYRTVIRDVTDAIYLPIWAQSFVVSSSIEGKSAIAPFAGDALTLVRSAKVKKYRRHGPAGSDGKRAPDGPEEIGLIAEEAPAEIVIPAGPDVDSPMIDLYAKTSLLWAGLQQEDARVDDLLARVTKLERGKAA